MLDFLTELTNQSSRCEEHYRYSDHLAEFFCTITNIGFFAVAITYHDRAALLAGAFSALSHAIPLKQLNTLDKLAASFAVATVLYNYNLLLTQPAVLTAGIMTMICGSLDLGIRYDKLNCLSSYRALIHSAWHLSAALTLQQLDHAKLLQTNPMYHL